MHLHELLGWPGPMTHRQFAAWQQWLEDQWNRPDRHDYYSMQAAQTNLRGKGMKAPPLEKMRIPFQFKNARPDAAKTPVGQTDQERRAAETRAAQARWLGWVGGRVRVVKYGEPVPEMQPRV